MSASAGTEPGAIRAAILVVSDRAAAGSHQDASGPEAQSALEAWGATILHRVIVPDEPEAIVERLLQFADRDRADLVITSGGTGFGPRDITPEATKGILEREAPGLSELLRRETARHTLFAALSRGVAGTRGKTLIVNLPGNPKGVVQCLEVLKPLALHAVRVLRGENAGHRPPSPNEARP